jgi:hypothetical protein
MKNSPLEWSLDPSPHFPHVEALTLKWSYRVHTDINVEDRWVAWRQIRHRALNDRYVGELFEDHFLSFESALAAAECWHLENDGDFDIEWVHRHSIYA